MKIVVTKAGGIWHGTIEGRTDVDERGLTEEIARRKAERIATEVSVGHVPSIVPEPRRRDTRRRRR